MTQSRTIFTGYGYTASIAGFNAINGPFLCVTRKDKRGKALSGVEAIHWAEAIETAIDNEEKRALCAAIYKA